MRITSEEQFSASLGNGVLSLYSFPNSRKLAIILQDATKDSITLLKYPEEKEVVVIGDAALVVSDITLENLKQLSKQLQEAIDILEKS